MKNLLAAGGLQINNLTPFPIKINNPVQNNHSHRPPVMKWSLPNGTGKWLQCYGYNFYRMVTLKNAISGWYMYACVAQGETYCTGLTVNWSLIYFYDPQRGCSCKPLDPLRLRTPMSLACLELIWRIAVAKYRLFCVVCSRPTHSHVKAAVTGLRTASIMDAVHAASSGLVASPNPIAAIPFARAFGKGLL